MAKGKRRRSGNTASGASLTPEQVVKLAVSHDLAELEIERGDIRIRVVREHAAGAAPRAGSAAGSLQSMPTGALALPSHLVTVEAPMVGTFYRASAPDAQPFVSEGDLVKEGQVLCIIEAMKLMNEIEAKAAGRISKVLVENAQPVEYGQPLFLVEPR